MDKNIWIKIVSGSLLTILLSIGGAVWTTGESSGQQKEQIHTLQEKMVIVETERKTDRDILVRIDERLKNIEMMVKELKERK